MLTLTLLRHAKSSWDYPGLDDFLRPLNARGYRQAARIWEGFPDNVDEIWCSPAVRAYTTASALLLARPELSDRMRLKPEIYDASSGGLWHLISHAGHLRHLTLVGHNPSLEILAERLLGEEVVLKTSHLLQLSLHSDSWSSLTPGCASTIRLWRPSGT